MVWSPSWASAAASDAERAGCVAGSACCVAGGVKADCGGVGAAQRARRLRSMARGVLWVWAGWYGAKMAYDK